MATKKAAAADGGELQILEVNTKTIEVCLIGRTPLIMNTMPAKAMQELLAPKGRKTAVEKASSLKHDPMKEYRASCYRMPKEDEPTALGMLATAFKGALRNAALDMQGARKSQIGRLVYVEGQMIPIYGVPEIFCSVTRSADINKTPDVRTRAILPKWATKIAITFVVPVLRDQSIANLLAGAGITIGIGDWRQEKGSGNYGLFRVCEPNDAEYLDIIKHGGRDAQLAALEDPQPHDQTTRELLDWFGVEMKRRGFAIAA